MWRQASATLSATLAAWAGSIPSGSATSMPSANGTASSSATAPPQCPPASPKPYIEIGGTARQLPVRPSRQAAQAPQLIWNGTTTRSPGDTVATCSPTATTSATHSWPKQSGSGNGAIPRASARSRSQVATASGRTVAPSGPGRRQRRNRAPARAAAGAHLERAHRLGRRALAHAPPRRVGEAPRALAGVALERDVGRGRRRRAQHVAGVSRPVQGGAARHQRERSKRCARAQGPPGRGPGSSSSSPPPPSSNGGIQPSQSITSTTPATATSMQQ